MRKPPLNIFLDRLEIEQALHQLGVVLHRVDHLDRHAAGLDRANAREVDVADIGDLVFADLLGVGEDGVGDLFRRRAAIADIVFYAEILVRTAGIVAGRQHQAAKGLVFADDVGGRRRGQNTVLADHHLAETVGGGHGDRLLDHLEIEVAAVAADHQRLALKPFQRVEHRLDEVFRVVLLFEHRHFLAQAGCAGLLVGSRAWS